MTGKRTKYDIFCDKLSTAYTAKKSVIDRCFLAVLFIILCGTRIFDISLRTQLHSDEIFSLMIATGNEYYNNPIPDGTYSGEELKALITADNRGGLAGAVDDIKQLWINNGDAPHASLYYMVLRFALIGYNHFNVAGLAWRGGILNLIFFALSFFVMYRLLRKIFGDNSLLVFSGLAMAFANRMAINNTLLIREYQMAETAILTLTLIGISLIIALRNKEEINLKKYFWRMAVTVALALSLGYFNAIFVILFGSVLVISAFKYKNNKLALYLILSAVAGLAAAYILYPGFFNFLLHDSVHKERAFSSVRNLFGNVLIRDITLQFFTMPGLIFAALALVIALLKGNRKEFLGGKNFAWITILAVAAMLIIQYASVLKMPRYYFPLVPLLVLLILHVFKCLPKSIKGYFEILFLLYFPMLAILFPARHNYNWHNLQVGLQQSAIIHSLNPNEVAQIIPCTQDTIIYTVSSQEYVDISRDKETFVVTKQAIGISNDSIKSMKRVLWGRHIFLYKFNFIPKEDRSNESN